MSEKTERLIILGGSASGKDHLRRELVKLGLRYSPKFTTRPQRLNENHGEDYDFIDYNLYVDFFDSGRVKTSQSFVINGINWYYGITKDNWNNNQLFIMTTEELRQIPEEDRKSTFVVYLNIDQSIRRERLLERNDNNDSINRRIMADEEDFNGFVDYDLSITDSEFEADWIYELMS